MERKLFVFFHITTKKPRDINKIQYRNKDNRPGCLTATDEYLFALIANWCRQKEYEKELAAIDRETYHLPNYRLPVYRR